MTQTRMALLLFASTLFGCSVGGAEEVVSYSGPDSPRISDALRGLDYDSGRARILYEGAGSIAARGDLEGARREYARGRKLLARNSCAEAIEAHTQAVLMAPEDPGMYQGLGDALLSERLLHRAQAAYQTGLDLDPNSPDLHCKLADALWRKAERDSAIDEWREAVRLDPDHGRSYVKLAVALYYDDDPEGAWRAVQRAEDLGELLPALLRGKLSEDMPEPRRLH